MGHIGVKGLQHAADGVDFDDSHLPSCTICAHANITCTPFPHHATHRATCLLERIHCDICSPLPTCFGNYRYFILFICCHSQYISLYLIKTCEEALQSFTQFQTLVENFCRKKITILCVDNAPELTKGKFKHFCTTEGISYEKTIPDSPSQNGVAEHCNHTLASMARALLIDADLSDWFWPFAIQTTVHIKNRIPHSIYYPQTKHRSSSGMATSLISPISGCSALSAWHASSPTPYQNSTHTGSPVASSAMPRTRKGTSSGYPDPTTMVDRSKHAGMSFSTISLAKRPYPQ